MPCPITLDNSLYVDDFALFDDDAGKLRDAKLKLDQYLSKRRLRLHPKKTFVASTFAGSSFLGFDLPSRGEIRLSVSNVDRFMANFRKMKSQNPVVWQTCPTAIARIHGWCGHATHAHTWRLRHSIFAGTAFDPAAKAA